MPSPDSGRGDQDPPKIFGAVISAGGITIAGKPGATKLLTISLEQPKGFYINNPISGVETICHSPKWTTKGELRSLLEEIIEKAKNVDLDKLEAEIEEEANKLARQKYKVLN